MRSLEMFVVTASLGFLLVACGGDETLVPFEEWTAARPVPAGFELLVAETTERTEDGSLTVTFDVDESITSFEISASTLSSVAVQLTSLAGPDGEQFPDQADGTFEGVEVVLAMGFLEARRSDNITLTRFGEGSFRFPNDARTEIRPGRWTLTLTTFDLELDAASVTPRATRSRAPAPLHVKVLGRRGALEVGEVDLHILLGPGTGFDAASAFDEASLMGALSSIDAILGSRGVTLGQIVFEDVPSLPTSVTLERNTCNPSSALRSIRDRVKVMPGYLPVLMLSGFSCSVQTTVGPIDIGSGLAGVSPGIPGVFTSEGEALLLSTELRDDYPRAWMVTLAHEMGHFLGLSHVAQPPYSLADNLEDTGMDSMNLMFPNVDEISAPLLTPQQGMVIRQSPYVHAPR